VVGQFTFHEVGELSGNAQAETERLGHSDRATGMLIRLEQRTQDRGRNSGPIISDLDREGPRGCRYLDLDAGTAIPTSIFEKVT
jgi:hypothetical protein